MMKRMIAICLTLSLISFFAFAQEAEVAYSVHMSGVGWGGYSSDGETAGTTGQSRQIEAIKVRVISDIAGGIRYDVHAAGVGWMGWSSNDDIAGTTGQNRRIEAIRVQLTGQLALLFDVMYRVHMADVGWSGWSENGDDAGTTGQSRQIEAIEIRFEPTGIALPVVADTSVQISPDTMLPFQNIHFHGYSSVLLPQEQRKLTQIAEVLRRYPNRNILVGGYTAMVGTAESRRQLSQERAQIVADYLISTGVRTADKIVIRGYGAERPVGDNLIQAGREKNRRVEIILLEEGSD